MITAWSRKHRKGITEAWSLLLTLLITAFCLSPLYWVLITSLKPMGAEYLIPIQMWPNPPTLQAYAAVIGQLGFLTPIRNSVIVALSTAVLALAVSSVSAYAIARMRFGFKVQSLLILQLGAMIPPVVTIAPTFVLLRQLGLLRTLPAMIIPHFLIAGPIEGIFSALVVAYLQRANRPVLELNANPALAAQSTGFGRLRALWVVLAVAVVATPLGLLAPGTAWGEWGSDQLSSLGLSFVPRGLAQLESIWGAPLAGYDLPALGNSNAGYILSAVVGIALVGFLAWLFTTLLAGRGKGASPQQGS